MPRRKTREEFIEQAEAKHGKDNFEYSKVIYKNTMTKVTIICKDGHEFTQRPNDHLRGDKCPFCYGRIKLTTEDFIKKANLKHNNKYDYSETDYTGSYGKVTIICPELNHGRFLQVSQSHLFGHGCPKCVGLNQTTEDFIRQAKEIHGDLYDYSLVNYINTKTKVKIICSKHGVFYQNKNSHITQKSGCHECVSTFKLTTETFINKANKVHNNKFNYSLTGYTNANKKVVIICPKHGEFKIAPAMHLYGQGCKQCGSENRAKSHLHNTDIFIASAKEVHGNRYDYSLVDYKHSKSKVIIICSEHGKFKQSPNTHLKYAGCPKCHNSSKGETFINKYLTAKNITFIEQKTFKGCKLTTNLRFDFYLPEYNLCIEFDGRQHFEPVEVFGGEPEFKLIQKRDITKNKYCQDNNIKLLRIPYTEFQNIDIILNKVLDNA